MGVGATLASLGATIVSKGVDLGKKLLESGKDSLVVAVPATALTAAYLVSRLKQPTAVKDNLTDIVINANEKTILAESIRDLERLKARKKLVSSAKIHDQFI